MNRIVDKEDTFMNKKNKASNWRELPIWLKYILPGIGILLLIGSRLYNIILLKDISLILLLFIGFSSFFYYTNENRKKSIKIALIVGFIGVLFISIIILYVRNQ